MKIIFQLLFLFFQIKIFQNKNCIKYYNFCIQCNENTDLCDYCLFPVFKPDLSGGCQGIKNCTQKNNFCSECNQDSTLCQNCEAGYFPDNNGGCSLAKNCEVSYRGDCQICKKNYSLVNDGKSYLECKKIPIEVDPYCKKYDDEGICIECIDDYFLTHGNKKCTKVFYCNNLQNDKCTECIPGFYLDKKDNNICKAYNDILYYCKETTDGEKCSLCRDGFFLSKDNRCVVSPNCLESKPKTYLCQECDDGYFLTSGGDCSITDHCKHLLTPDSGKCYICEQNYYVNTKTGMCKSNQEDNKFKYCDKGSDFCESCIIYYHLGEDHKCSKSRNCSESVDAVCMKCDNTTYLTENNKCIGTDHCILSDDYYRCIQCEEGYFYNYTSNGCISDEDYEEFKNCKNLDYTGENCFECRKNYYLNKTDNKCYLAKEKSNLYKCSEINEKGVCTKCENKYYLGKLDNKCSSIYGCEKSENVNTCLQCNSRYCLTDGRCNYTDMVEEGQNGYCYKCVETNENGKGCKKCFEGYNLLENGFCSNLEYCEDKEDNNCLKCKNDAIDEYGFNLLFCANKNFGCVEISNDICLRCDDIYDFDKCTKCVDGYYSEDGECLKCKEGCGKCTNEDNCGKCLEGYYVKNNFGDMDIECEKCIDGCKKCDNDFECEECLKGYYLTNKKNEEGILECVKCTEGCIDCYDDEYCLECEDGYNLVDEDGKIICEKKKE